jgi:hypothetical protein
MRFRDKAPNIPWRMLREQVYIAKPLTARGHYAASSGDNIIWPWVSEYPRICKSEQELTNTTVSVI